jgi:predicted AlkP superfamily pyrophosphatase or phosphodiesterase
MLAAALLVAGAGCKSDGSATDSTAEEPEAVLDTHCDGGAEARTEDAPVGPEAAPEGGGEDTLPVEQIPDRPIIFIALDALDARYLSLNEFGEKGGSEGHWLLPNLHDFLARATRFDGARCFLPAATDMNHLNTMAGTSSAQTGIIGISVQVYDWDENTEQGKYAPPHTSWARDENGEKVVPLFRLVKDKWPAAKTAFVSGKAWVADMYRKDASGFDPGVDLIVTATDTDFPAGVPDPSGFQHSWVDPKTDGDAACDPESALQVGFASLPAVKQPSHFTPDEWTSLAALAVFEKEQPDLALVLMAQIDDAQHILGAAWDPDEFENALPPYTPPAGESCAKPMSAEWSRWQLVSKRNKHVYREPILDQIRDSDQYFGDLLEGLEKIDKYKNATIVVYSDHGHLTHLFEPGWVPGETLSEATDFIKILIDAGIVTEDEYKNDHGFKYYSGTSIGYIYFYPDQDKEGKIEEALLALKAHKAENPQTGNLECPWDVLGKEEMQKGLDGVAAEGELDHKFFDNTPGRFPVWPDIILLCRNGWQAPVYKGQAGNIGVDLPDFTPTVAALFGGHGAPDTQPILLAVAGQEIAAGKVVPADPNPGDAVPPEDFRNADITVTVAALYGLTFPHKTVGKDRSADLK